jgi:SNF-related kinase
MSASSSATIKLSQKGGIHQPHALNKSWGFDPAQITAYYNLENTIGQGHFATVKRARHIFTGEKVAIKVIDKLKLDQISREHLFQEVKCMKLVQHKNVVRLYEVIDTKTKLYLILELGYCLSTPLFV